MLKSVGYGKDAASAGPLVTVVFHLLAARKMETGTAHGVAGYIKVECVIADPLFALHSTLLQSRPGDAIGRMPVCANQASIPDEIK
jgi:hypothetical protein